MGWHPSYKNRSLEKILHDLPCMGTRIEERNIFETISLATILARFLLKKNLSKTL